MAERLTRGLLASLFSGGIVACAAFGCGAMFRAAQPRPAPPATRVAQATRQTGNYPKRYAGFRTHPHPAGGKIRRQDDPAEEGSASGVFDTVYGLVKEYYVDPLPAETRLSQGAVRAMLNSLNDPNSFFLTPEQRVVWERESEGQFGGIGAHIAVLPQKRDGFTEYKIVIVSPLPNGGADRAGLKSGDVITHIDDKWVLGSDPFLRVNKLMKRRGSDETDADVEQEYRTARQRVRGGIGLMAAQILLHGSSSKILRLTVERAGVKEPVPVSVTPVPVAAAPPTFRELDGKSYVRLPFLNGAAAKRFAEHMATLAPETKIILDLRGTAGGSLEAAQGIYALLTGGGVFAQEIVAGGKRVMLAAPALPGVKRRGVVVLINGGTANAAEALALALRDGGTATIAGDKRTFGDALLQTLYTLGDGSAFVLTTGEMLSAGKSAWNGIGLAPSVVIPANVGEEAALERAQGAFAAR